MTRKFTAEQATAAIGKTAKLLAKSSVKVTTQGARAFIEWFPSGDIKRINLPMVPREADDKFLSALQGFLDHEVGHALHTDPVAGRTLEDEYIKKSGVNPGIVRGMSNIVEDCRIERAMEDQFPGSRRNLEAVRNFFVEDMQKPTLDGIPAGEEYDDERRSYIIPIFFRARAGQTACEHFMDDYDLWQYVETYDELFPDLPARLAALKSTEDAVRLACEIIEATSETTPPDSDEADPDASEESESGEKSDDKSDNKSGGSNDENEEQDEQDEPTDGSDDGDSDDEGDTDVDDTGGSEGDPSDGDDNDESMSDEAEADGSGDDVVEDDSTHGDKLEKKLVTFDPDKFKDFDDAAAEALEKAIGEIETSDNYYIFSRDKDRIEPAPLRPHTDISKMEDAVEKTSGVLRKELQRLIAARSLDHMVPGHRSGKIHAASLHRLRVGDDRVFARKHTTQTKDTAVSLVVDCSGSMTGEKIQCAMESAWAFADVLTRLNVKNEVIGFTTSEGFYTKRSMRFDPEEVDRYRRTVGAHSTEIRQEPLYMPIFKDFSENFGQDQKKRMAWYPENGELVQNIDGECVRIAAARLANQRASRHVMIVFSDGEPAAHVSHVALERDLKKAVKEIEDAGIETIGIGIQSHAVERFYPKNFVIHNSSDLAGATIRELKSLLIS